MNDDILNSLDLTDKASFKAGLEALIEQTYVIENEYKNIKKSYDSLIVMINEIIEVLPSAIWVLNDNKEIFLKNKLADDELFSMIDLNNPHYELELKNNFYQIKSSKYLDKTLIVATNITKEKRNERLVSMGQVAANLAHEIRNPIGSVLLLASTLYNKVELKNKFIVLQMQEAIKRVERIIETTLLFTRGVKANLIKHNIKELESECQKIFDEYNKSDEVYLENLCFEECELLLDKSLFQIVLSNLIYNAIDAVDENGTISIIGKKQDDKYTISVLDSADDVLNEDLLFEAFNTTKLKGNGLGLALSKQICDTHNAKIYYKKSPKAFIIEFLIK